MHSISLCSAPWRFRDAAKATWLPAVVPGCVHTDLRRNGKIPDPFWAANELDLQWIEERDWEYRASFTLPHDFFDEETIELVADGLDTVAAVTLNGHELGRTDNMFVSHRWNVRSVVRYGANTLTVRFESAMAYLRAHRLDLEQGEINDPLGRAPAIRKQQCQFGWDWGPRFVTAGIWRDIRLEAWTGNRLVGVRVVQAHTRGGSVALNFIPELAHTERGVSIEGSISIDGHHVTNISEGTALIWEPQLWFPRGHGAQPLYEVDIDVRRADRTVIGHWSRRLGLRTIVLDRHRDTAGETFQFVVNGRPIFAKGANWIPAHTFVADLTRDRYARDLRSAAEANMNMIRVWGGGIYETEDFYDLCDELGLLVWQDFMFACALYPADHDFVQSVRTEAVQQIRRLRHRACLALWCGNNEVEQLNVQRLKKPHLKESYAEIFEHVLPDAVKTVDGVTPYWPSSQHRPDNDNTHAAGERAGDTHFWDVWHARHPVKAYEKWRFRFCSEFGMQSYSSPETNATFCPASENNVFGPAMENHQKNRGGNQVILEYVSRRYRFPKNQDDLIYLSQLNQAYCMQTGVEHFRRLMPHCMGALYWQLNDCWPVASWSSIEFTGRWRALHHVARRFFSPALVCAHVPGDETPGVGNYRHSDVRVVHICTVYDAPEPASGMLRWDLYHLNGRVVLRGAKRVALNYGESVRQQTLDLVKAIEKHGRDSLVLRLRLEVNGHPTSEDTVFLSPPRFLALPRGRTRAQLRKLGNKRAELRFISEVFQHRFAFEFPGIEYRCTDNYFELYPGERKTVEIELSRAVPLARLKKALKFRSLVDTY